MDSQIEDEGYRTPSRGSDLKIWENLFLAGEFVWKDPHELVVNLLPSLDKLSGKRILDLGCGAGRHSVFLSGHGYDCHGTDIAFSGVGLAKRWLLDQDFPAKLSQSEMDQLPYAACSFAAVVCLFVIYHGTIKKIERVFQEIHRVLRPDGLSLVTFISDRHHRMGRGEEIEPNTFITNVGADAGVPHHFFKKDEILRTARDFEVVEMTLLEKLTEDGLQESHWASLIKKV